MDRMDIGLCVFALCDALYWIAKTAVSLCIIYIKSNGDGAVGESYGSFVCRSAAQTKRKGKVKGRNWIILFQIVLGRPLRIYVERASLTPSAASDEAQK